MGESKRGDCVMTKKDFPDYYKEIEVKRLEDDKKEEKK